MSFYQKPDLLFDLEIFGFGGNFFLQIEGDFQACGQEEFDQWA